MRAAHRALAIALALLPAACRATWWDNTASFVNQVDGKPIDLHYRKFGSGRSRVLFIMGTAAPWEAWEKQIAHISRKHQVCVFDNRGVGKSSTPDGAFTTDAMAQDALQLMDHLGWQKAHVVGFSLGGMIAMKLASRHAERVKSLALLSTHTGGFFRRSPTIAGLHLLARVPFVRSHETRAHLDLCMHYTKKYLRRQAEGAKNATRTVYQQMFSKYLAARRKASHRCRGLAQQVGAVLSHRMRRDDLRALRETDCPKLVLHGDSDVIIHPSNAVYLSSAIDADLEIVDSNHMAVVECAERLNELLDDHIDAADAKTTYEELRGYRRLTHRLRERLRSRLGAVAARWRDERASRRLARLTSREERSARVRYWRYRYFGRRLLELSYHAAAITGLSSAVRFGVLPAMGARRAHDSPAAAARQPPPKRMAVVTASAPLIRHWTAFARRLTQPHQLRSRPAGGYGRRKAGGGRGGGSLARRLRSAR